ncbi:hypothetical protein [Labilibacter marinus]|uniref:hypothetical protein n=1 Tax=Labilibacter marinus TaxID=1477105 RepID=UPI00094F4C7C|nr:hypothetical protein [Labilibacter marinus]
MSKFYNYRLFYVFFLVTALGIVNATAQNKSFFSEEKFIELLEEEIGHQINIARSNPGAYIKYMEELGRLDSSR